MIAARKVCPADASGKKYVAGEEDLVAGGVEAKASGTVTGNQKNTKGPAAKIKLSGLFDQEVRVDGFCFKKETSIFKEIRICHQRDPIFVITDLASGGPLDLGGVIEMVGVTVCEDQQIESYPQIMDPIR
jgi:hypothetical protein